jgi:DNA polymerase|nr:uracil-DNA glycosylase family protein [Candidatus Krumholzibacteria bacterium]
MKPCSDDIQQFRAEFLAWLQQNGSEEGAWFLDEGPVPETLRTVPAEPVTAEPVMAEPVMAEPVTVEPVIAAPVTVPVPPSRPASPLAPDPDDPFAAECAQFVAETLQNYRRQVGSHVPEGAGPGAEADLVVLRDEVLPCTDCALHETRHHTVFGAGNPRAEVLFIGEAPGRDEDLQGEPFVGASGQLLTKIIGAIGFSRDDVYICNILKCRPPGNRDPLPEEVARCEPHLQRQLDIIRPRVICCLGRVAAQTLLKTTASLGALRKTAHFYQGIPVLATYHPAALLRNPGWKRDTWNDVRKLRALSDALADPARLGEAGE